MINVAIVEDEQIELDLMKTYLEKYHHQNKIDYTISSFISANSFMKEIHHDFDIVFLDIELTDGNGMDLARSLRKVNSNVIIIFVTNMAQYAIKGYEVRAFDFIVKPINYNNFVIKFTSAIDCLYQKKDVGIWISNKEGKKYLPASKIKYVEVVNHMINYHTLDGVISASGSLNSIINDLGPSFALCNRCYLVNLRYVTEINQFDVIVGSDRLQISRLKRKEFVRLLNNYYASGD